MDQIQALDYKQTSDLLLAVSTSLPVFLWGPPGIGKSSIVEQFADSVGLECVPLMGSQLAPEDLIGVPKVIDDVTRFFPPSLIVRKEPFCLFMDEMNLGSPEIQKAFYSLINEQRVGEYRLPKGSIIIGAGNRAIDSALVRPLPSALINRMLHIRLTVSSSQWLDWARNNSIHPLVLNFIEQRPKFLVTHTPPTVEIPFSTPRSWQRLSQALYGLGDNPDPILIAACAYGLVSPEHATYFLSFCKMQDKLYILQDILKGKEQWPKDPQERDLLLYLVHSLRDLLHKELPEHQKLTSEQTQLVSRVHDAIRRLCYIEDELAQLLIQPLEDGTTLPNWFLIQMSKEMPKLVAQHAQS